MREMTTSSINTTRVKDCLIVTLGDDLSGGAIDATRLVVLDNVHKEACLSVVFELSALKFMDTEEFEALKSISEMAAMLGAQAIFSGLNPGIIFHLILNDAQTNGVSATLDLNEALRLLGITNDVDRN